MFQNSYISELVRDLSFAVFRVAVLVEHTFLKKELERAAIELAAYVDGESICQLERLVSLSASVGEIGTTNSEVLLRELGNLRSLLDAEDEAMGELEADLSDLFGNKGSTLPFKTENGKKRKAGSTKVPSKRQTEILEIIRQFPKGCRMADLARNFSEVGKRTLRNDVSALISRGELERVGNRGPYSYLRVPSVDFSPEEGREPVILLSEPQI